MTEHLILGNDVIRFLRATKLGRKNLRTKFPDPNTTIPTEYISKDIYSSGIVTLSAKAVRKNSSRMSRKEGRKGEAGYGGLIELWNQLPSTPKFRGAGTKRYRQTNKYLKYLHEGSFGEKCKVDREWLSQKQVPHRWLRKKWSMEQLEEGLQMLGRMFVEGYWPHNKKWVPRSLAALIYNPYNHTSWFLAVMKNPIGELAEEEERRERQKEGASKSATLRALDEMLKFYGSRIPRGKKRRELQRVAREMVSFHASLPRDQWGILEHAFPNSAVLTKEYRRWLAKKNIYNPTPRYLGVDSELWRKFVKHVSKDLGVSLKTGRELNAGRIES